MTCVYVSTPIVIGYFIMQIAISQSEKNLGKRGEKLIDGTSEAASHVATSDQNKALQMLLNRHRPKDDDN